jgi:hypothetical protein
MIDYKKMNNLFVLKNNSLYLYYYKINDFFEKSKLQKLNLITITNNLDCSNNLVLDSDSSCSCEYQQNFETFILFKKNTMPKKSYDNFLIKIDNQQLFITDISNSILTIQIDRFLDQIKQNIDKITQYKTSIQDYENSNKIIDYINYIENYENIYQNKSTFNLNKSLLLKDIYEKYLEFFSILTIDIENLLLFSQTESLINQEVIISSYQSLINNLYSRFNMVNKNIPNISDISLNSKNIDIFYKEKTGFLIFFGKINTLTQNVVIDTQENVTQLIITFSTTQLVFNSLKNQILDFENFEKELLNIKKNIEIIKILVELNLKIVCDLIYILSQV